MFGLPAKLRLAVLIGLLLLTLAYAWRKWPRNIPGIPPQGGVSAQIMLDKIPFYLQTDARWGGQLIGGSAETLAAVGCTITSVSMALAHFGIALPPDRLNALLKARGGYTSEGWLVWDKINDVTQGKIKLVIPEQVTYPIIDQALQHSHPVIANVLIEQKVAHWVLILGKSGQDYLIHDPLGRGVEKITKFNSPIFAIRIVQPNKQ